MSQQPVFGRLVGARSLRHFTWHRIESANMSTPNELHVDKKEYDDAIAAVSKTHNILLGSGIPGPTLMAAEAACTAVVFANIIKHDPEKGQVYVDNWLTLVRRTALKYAK